MRGERGPAPLTGNDKQTAEQSIARYFEAKISEAEKAAAQAEAGVRAVKAAAADWDATRTLSFLEAFSVACTFSGDVTEAGQGVLFRGGSRAEYERLRDDFTLVRRYLREVLGHNLEGDSE